MANRIVLNETSYHGSGACLLYTSVSIVLAIDFSLFYISIFRYYPWAKKRI